MNNTLIAALYKIAEDASEDNPLASLVQSLRRISTSETEDKGTSEGAKKGWETRRHGRPSIWDEVKTRVASIPFRGFRKKLTAISEMPKVQQEVERLGGFGTFDVATGEPIKKENRQRGYQASFCTTSTEDPNHPNYLNDSAFDSTVEEMARQTGSNPEVGVYKGGCEISFHIKTKKQLKQLMRYHNQQSGLNWATKWKVDKILADNPDMPKEQKDNIFYSQFEPNDFYDPSSNDI